MSMNLDGAVEYQGGGSSFKPGVNQLFLKEFSIDFAEQFENYQLKLTFGSDPKIGEGATTSTWIKFSKEIGENQTDEKFKNILATKLSKYVPLLAAIIGKDAAQDWITNMKATYYKTLSFDPKDKPSVQKVEKGFVELLLQALPKDFHEKEVDVVMHYNYNSKGNSPGWYVNIPSVKENGWNFPFGLGVIVGDGLTMEKPVATLPTTEELDTPVKEVSINFATPSVSDDLPF